MSDMKVVSLNGNAPILRERNDQCVAALEDALEEAKSGEIVGVSIIKNYHDGQGSFHYAGTVGGFSMVGAHRASEMMILRIAMDED